MGKKSSRKSGKKSSRKSGKKSKSKKSKSKKGSSNPDVPKFHNDFGEFNYPNGDKYVGDYWAHISGVAWKEGFGSYETKDGHIYKGNWKDDKLIEGSNVEIIFPDGTLYCGQLVKSKFHGTGSYIVRDNLSVVCTFADSKPVKEKELLLLDPTGKTWQGIAMKDDSILYPENLYYKNISDTRGIGAIRHKSRKPTKEGSVMIVEPEVVEDKAEEEKRIFGKSTKLPEKYDYESSDWYRNYISFKRKQQIIMRKARKGTRTLNEEEKEWLAKYKEFKEKYNKIMANRKEKPNDPVDITMLDTFYSEEYQASKPTFVMYPTKPDTEENTVQNSSNGCECDE